MSLPTSPYPPQPPVQSQRRPSFPPLQSSSQSHPSGSQYGSPYVSQYGTSPSQLGTSPSVYGTPPVAYGTPPGPGFYGSTPPRGPTVAYETSPRQNPAHPQLPLLHQYPSGPQMLPLQQQPPQQQMPPLPSQPSHQAYLTPYNPVPTSVPSDPDLATQRHRAGSYASSHHSHKSHRSQRSSKSDNRRDKSDRATLGDTMWILWDSVKALMPVGKR